ncbi:MAG: hypothetical protein KGM47_04630 [Acidobacteriota bacterium]|nr:hypothetical protein [Acidobacteriota bacterium]
MVKTMPPSANADLVLEDVIGRLARLFGSPKRERKARIVRFGSSLVCSLNYSKLIRGAKYFFGLPPTIADPGTVFAPTKFGEFVLLICGASDRVLVLPRSLVTNMLADVPSRRVDVFFENDTYVMQTTKHPKTDVTVYLNAFPTPETGEGADAGPEGAAETPTTPDRVHLRIQSALISLGRAEGCSVWVPVNDRNLSFKGEPFSRSTLARLPNFGFDEMTRRVVQNIDVLWLTKNVIRKGFEIESTTSIYSGLLRLNDLVLAQPNNQVDLYLAASGAWRNRVYSQLLRPSFQPLLTKCQFIAFEDIERKMTQLKNLPLDRGARVSGLVRGERFDVPEHLLYPEDV